ncbi:hypothetical protein ACLJYM_02265 [Rhizobium giardinii]|uniref:hypothetical protein n=1 Tax=Rhizobium giardinii TaxID=56731 RepID=UPI0039E115D3
MSKGAGKVEQRIAELFAVTRDRALSMDDITDNAYSLNGAKPTREQRLSAARAAHRLLRRVRETEARVNELYRQAHDNTKASLRREQSTQGYDGDYWDLYHADPAYVEAHKQYQYCLRIGCWVRILRIEDRPDALMGETDFWMAETFKGRLYFHPPDVPLRVWAVSIQRDGIVWAEAEVTRITERNVMVRYAGETARLDRRHLWYWWTFWRGVRFVSSRTGRIARELDDLWWQQFGSAADGVPPSMQLPLAEAMALLGVKEDYTREDVIVAFRRKAKLAHPDIGGTAEMFRKLVDARDRLLAAIGTKAAPPKAPEYAPKGTMMIYRPVSQSRARIGRGTQAMLGKC